MPAISMFYGIVVSLYFMDNRRHNRVNDQFRVCFRWTAGGAEDVTIVDYH